MPENLVFNEYLCLVFQLKNYVNILKNKIHFPENNTNGTMTSTLIFKIHSLKTSLSMKVSQLNFHPF